MKCIVGNGNGGAVGHQQTDAAQGRQRGQRHDEGRQTKFANPKSVENADGETQEKRDHDGRPNRETICQQHGDDNTGKANDRAHRQIDAGRDDDKRLADGEDRGHGALPQQVRDVVISPEALRAKRQHNPHQREQREKGQAQQGPNPRPVSGRGQPHRFCGFSARLAVNTHGWLFSGRLFSKVAFIRRQTPIASVKIVSCTAFSPTWLETSLPRRNTCRVSEIS